MKKLLAIVFMSAFMLGTVAATTDADLTPKEQIIKQILQKKYNYDATGILKAVKNGDKDAISLFLASGYDPNTTILKLPAIYWAIKLKKADIVDRDYSLVPSRYIEFVNRDESVGYEEKMAQLQGELKDLLIQEQKSRQDLLEVMKGLGYGIEL